MEDIDKFHTGIDLALKSIGKEDISLKEAQYEALKAIVLKKKDTLAILPTGYGKSLIYQSLPYIFDHVESSSSSLVIVVSPLNALMQDQVEKLKEKMKVQILKANDCRDVDATCKIVFAHPEVFMVPTFRSSSLFKQNVKAIVVDEAHLVVEWKDFRPAYGKVSLLSSYFPSVPIIGLTATATVKMQKEISSSLGLVDPLLITINPDRENIFFASFTRKSTGDDKLDEILDPLAKELKEKRQNFPLTLVYGNLETISECYIYFSQALGMDQYHPPGSSALAKNRMFSQFHAQYPEHERKRIVTELVNGKSKLRILFVTVSFGIGIDIQNIRQVIHIGVPYTMEEYFQEAGRCGRDGLPAKAIIYYNSYDISTGKKQMSEIMRTFVQANKCKREIILSYFGHPLPKRKSTDHTCCDFHQHLCECDSCLLATTDDLQKSVQALSVTDTAQDSPSPKNQLPDGAKKLLYDALHNYRLSLHGSGPSCVGGVSLATGFSIELIDEIVDKALELNSVDDIMAKLPIFSQEHAERVLNILHALTRPTPDITSTGTFD